jgi:putative hemolysin
MKPACLIVLLLVAGCADGMKNPSAVYCKGLGYEYRTAATESGGQIGECVLPDGSEVSAWRFLEGKAGAGYGGCEKKGYVARPANGTACRRLHSPECTVCVLPDGGEVEVTELMKLDFKEGICGDGACTTGEDSLTCQKDCPSGSSDGRCDAVADGRCDPDCEESADPECAADDAGQAGCMPLLLASVAFAATLIGKAARIA